MAIQSQPSRIPEPFAGSGSKNAIPATNSTPSASQAASWASGFPAECSLPLNAGGCPVPRDDVNGIFNQISQGYAYQQDGGVWAWSASADYDVQRVVRGSDGRLYWSRAQSGPNVSAGAQDPVSDTAQTYWGPLAADVSGNAGTATTLLGTQPMVYKRSDVLHRDVDNGTLIISGGDSPSTGAHINLNGPTRSGSEGHFNIHAVDGNGNDKILFGSPAGTLTWDGQTIQTSSDERIKTPLDSVPDDVLDAWEDVNWGQFRFLDAVARKGEGEARLHLGLIAQRVKAVFEERGLDACQYGILCHEDSEEIRDLWMVRYTEALAMETCCQRRRADRAEARLAALEERLAAIEAKLSS